MSEKLQLSLNGRPVRIEAVVHRTGEPTDITPELVDVETGEVLAVLLANNFLGGGYKYCKRGIMGSLQVNHGDWSLSIIPTTREKFEEIKKQCNTSQ